MSCGIRDVSLGETGGTANLRQDGGDSRDARHAGPQPLVIGQPAGRLDWLAGWLERRLVVLR